MYEEHCINPMLTKKVLTFSKKKTRKLKMFINTSKTLTF